MLHNEAGNFLVKAYEKTHDASAFCENLFPPLLPLMMPSIPLFNCGNYSLHKPG